MKKPNFNRLAVGSLSLIVAVALSLPVMAAVAKKPGKGWYHLETKSQAGKCLEGYHFDWAKVGDGGAAFMDSCQDVTGQLWKFVPEKGGFYRLKTEFQGQGKCFESNHGRRPAVRRPGNPVFAGAAFMDKCQGVSGQLWMVEPEGTSGYYRLKSQFQGKDRCLQAENLSSGAAPGKAVTFMEKCGKNTGNQLWKLAPAG